MSARRRGYALGEADSVEQELRHRAAMREGSENLRNRLLDMLAEREAKFKALVMNHDAARKAIRKGNDKAAVMAEFGLSETAFEQLAAQVRAGAA